MADLILFKLHPGMEERNPKDAEMALKALEEQRRILRRAWVRATGSVDVLVTAMLADVEDKIKNLNPLTKE
jgi:hypothetical protein